MTEFYISFRGKLRDGEWGPWRTLDLGIESREEAEAIIENEKASDDPTARMGWVYEYMIEEKEVDRD